MSVRHVSEDDDDDILHSAKTRNIWSEEATQDSVSGVLMSEMFGDGSDIETR